MMLSSMGATGGAMMFGRSAGRGTLVRICEIEGLIVSKTPLEDSQKPIICLIYLHRQLVGRCVGKAYPDQCYNAVAQPGH